MRAEASHRLSAEACRDEDTLRAFVENRISVNAWPIHSRTLRRRVADQGLDLSAALRFEASLPCLEHLMRRIVACSLRIERALGVNNPYHNTLHNLEVFLRLLLLEWPAEQPVPRSGQRAATRVFESPAILESVIAELMGRLLELGVPSWRLARDLLAGVGHDYGHTGGTDRRGADGQSLPLTHEETAERHVARFGLDAGMPPALILESLAGIRATTFHIRPGRRPVEAANHFERQLTLADIAGWVLVPNQWLRHVSVSVLVETLDCHGRGATVQDLAEFFESELNFLRFSRDQRLAAVPSGQRLWAQEIERKIALIERVLGHRQCLARLKEGGYALLETTARQLFDANDLASYLATNGVNPNLRTVLEEFLEG